MEYLLSTFRMREFRVLPVALVLATILVGGFWLGAVYFGDTAVGNFLRAKSASGTVTTGSETSLPATVAHVAAGPMISFNFDDGYESAYLKALPIFDTAGFKTTFYIVTGRIGHQGYVNEAQLRSIAKRGHEIGALSQTLTRLVQISKREVRTEIEAARDDLAKLGYAVAPFAYPYGELNSMVQEEVKAAGFFGGRSLGSGENSTSTNAYALSGLEVHSDTKFATVKAAIDKAAIERLWLILVFSRIDDKEVQDQSSVSSAFIKQIVQYVKSKKIPVVTTEEGLRG